MNLPPASTCFSPIKKLPLKWPFKTFWRTRKIKRYKKAMSLKETYRFQSFFVHLKCISSSYLNVIVLSFFLSLHPSLPPFPPFLSCLHHFTQTVSQRHRVSEGEEKNHGRQTVLSSIADWNHKVTLQWERKEGEKKKNLRRQDALQGASLSHPQCMCVCVCVYMSVCARV